MFNINRKKLLWKNIILLEKDKLKGKAELKEKKKKTNKIFNY